MLKDALNSTSSNAPPSPVDTAEQRNTMRQGLRILAKIIARAHLRRQADRSSAAAPGPPPEGTGEESCVPVP